MPIKWEDVMPVEVVGLWEDHVRTVLYVPLEDAEQRIQDQGDKLRQVARALAPIMAAYERLWGDSWDLEQKRTEVYRLVGDARRQLAWLREYLPKEGDSG